MDKPVTGSLLDVYRPNHFSLWAYYVHCFGVLASNIRLELPMEPSREKVDAVLKSIDLERYHFEPCFKSWYTEDWQTTKLSEDYTGDYIFQSETGRMLIDVWIRGNTMFVDFLYDLRLPETEKWLLDLNHHLRSTFGVPEMPQFRVLTFSEGEFGTESVSTGDFDAISIGEAYNDDFAEIHSIIVDAIGKKGSGIVLLHGEPGTGKTTYVKHLISQFKDREFIFVQNDFVRDLLKPGFISFLLRNKDATLIIEDAEKVVASRESSDQDSVVSTILQLTDGLFSDFLNIKIICTFNTDIDRIDKALWRKGRMIAKYHFKALTPEKTAALAKKLGREGVRGSLTLAEVYHLDLRDFNESEKKPMGFLQS